MDTATKEGKYIYCITEASAPGSFGPLGIGGRGDPVHTVCCGDVAAVVSNAQIKKYRVSRENTLAHEKVIETVMSDRAVLPVRFATVTEDEEKVMNVLKAEYDEFRELLRSMKGKVELGVKAVFKADAVYGHILDKYQNIRTPDL